MKMRRKNTSNEFDLAEESIIAQLTQEEGEQEVPWNQSKSKRNRAKSSFKNLMWLATILRIAREVE